AALRGALADAAGSTGVLPTAAPPSTGVTRQIDRKWPPRAARAPSRPARVGGAWPALVGLLLLGAVGGALAAYLLTRGNDHPTPAAVPQPRVTTVLQTVTQPSGTPTTVTQVTTTPPAQ